MKYCILVACLFVFAYGHPQKETAAPADAAAADKTAATDAAPEQTLSKYVRYLPADVLRDFPDFCFSSTSFERIPVGGQWSLAPYCGRSTCLRGDFGEFIERVEDCGPPPLPHNCKVINEAAAAEAFPLCCRKYECPAGETLKYPEPVAPAPQGEGQAQPQEPAAAAPQSAQ